MSDKKFKEGDILHIYNHDWNTTIQGYLLRIINRIHPDVIKIEDISSVEENGITTIEQKIYVNTNLPSYLSFLSYVVTCEMLIIHKTTIIDRNNRVLTITEKNENLTNLIDVNIYCVYKEIKLSDKIVTMYEQNAKFSLLYFPFSYKLEEYAEEKYKKSISEARVHDQEMIDFIISKK